MKRILVLALLIAATIGITSFDVAYAEESPLQINADINLEQLLVMLAIAITSAVVTSLEGQHRSGEKFNKGKFFIAVKRAATISIPATLTMMIAYPDPTITSYIMVGLAIILGTKMMGGKPKDSTDIPVQPLEKSAITVSAVSSPSLTIPKLGPADAKYQTNFVKGKEGNTLIYGTDLWIRRVGVRSYVTAILRDAAGNVIQVDQSHLKDEDGDIETTRLEMYARDGQPLPRGKYSVETFGDSGSSDGTGNNPDVFYIV